MTQPIDPTVSVLEQTLLALQVFQVAFLWLHDWIPLGSLNDVAAVRRQYTLCQRIVTTLLQSLPWTIGLFLSARNYGRPWAHWPNLWLWISYGILFVGEITAWWKPYLWKIEPDRAERYQRMFGNTHAFLPKRNGIVPNTLHVLLHLATFATLLVLAILESKK